MEDQGTKEPTQEETELMGPQETVTGSRDESERQKVHASREVEEEGKGNKEKKIIINIYNCKKLWNQGYRHAVFAGPGYTKYAKGSVGGTPESTAADMTLAVGSTQCSFGGCGSVPVRQDASFGCEDSVQQLLELVSLGAV